MSNARSPRDVCSTTIGTNGLIGSPPLPSAGLTGRPDRGLRDRRLGLLVVSRCPQLLACCLLLGGDRRRDLTGPVERALEPELLARRLLRPRGKDLLHRGVDVFLVGELIAQRAHELLVADLDALALGEGLERQLAAQRSDRLGQQRLRDLLHGATGLREERPERDSLALDVAREISEQLLDP